MNLEISEVINIRNWNRNMLNSYWLIILTSTMAKAIYLLNSNQTEWSSFVVGMIHPLTEIIIILIITELLNFRLRQFNEYAIIICGTLIVATIFYYHPNTPALYNASFLPILISVFYYKVRMVLFSFTTMIIVTFLLFFINLNNGDYNVLLIKLITTISILVCGTVICLGIMHRGIELVERLRSTMESRQELLVQNIIMDRLSKIDPLTELYNHMTFHEYLARLTEQSDKFGFSLQLAVLDIDSFKKVNDTYGHRAGDAVLKRIAQSLQQNVQANDFVARYGGEEFVILFSEKNLDDVYQILEQIRIQITAIHHPELGSEIVTISIGLTEYKRRTNKEVVFQLADEALYAAKKSGKNRILIKTEADNLSM